MRRVKMHLMYLFVLLVFMCVQTYTRLASAAEPCGPDAAPAALTLYVAPHGNDKWSGKTATPSRRDGPLATLTGARDKVRQARASKVYKQPIKVIVAQGTYALTTPVVFTAQDSGTELSPVCYQAAPGARPVFSGGRRVSGWQPGADGVWWTDIAAVRDGTWYFEQLWVNGRRARRARAADDTVTYTVNVQEQQLGTGVYQQTITVNAADVQLLAGLSAAELADVNFVGLHKWNSTRRFIKSADVQAGVLTVQSAAPMASYNPMTAWMPFYLDNFRTALDQPGEWFLARDGRLYYKPRPGEDMATAAVIAPVSSQFLVLSGNPATNSFVRNIAFDGLHFEYSQWLTPPGGVDPVGSSPAGGAIEVQAASNVVFRNCGIAHTGTYGIMFWNGTRDTALRRCKLEDLGAGGVRIGDTVTTNPYAAQFTYRVTVDNNIIRHGGRFFHNAYGIWIGRSSDNQVTHNEVADFFQHGISVGWIWGYGSSPTVRNNISYNHIHHLGWRVLSDIGGIHTLGVSPGTTLDGNVIHDIFPLSYGGWGLYLDEGSTSISARDNLVYNNYSGLHLHYGLDNTVSNNIFANNLLRQLLKTREEWTRSITFSRNIVYWGIGSLFKGFDAKDVLLENNLYFDASGRPIQFGSMDFATWQASGYDAGSIIADPLFYDPAQADFGLREGSPALSLGFVPFDASLAGVYGDLAWVDEAARVSYPVLEMPPAPPSFAHLP